MFQIKSSESDASLEITDFRGEYFKVTLRSSSHFAARDVYAYTDAQGIASLFREAAEQWRGWSGSKKWSSIEGEFVIELKADNKGHISLTAQISHDIGNADPWKLESTISIEAGQLEDLARQAHQYFSGTQAE